MSNNKQAGFSLIEMAIVLIVVAVLMGGVMKGFQMVESAKVQTLRQNLDQVQAAWLGYQSRFRQLPGDAQAQGQVGDGVEAQALFWAQLVDAGYLPETARQGLRHAWSNLPMTVKYQHENLGYQEPNHALCLPELDGLVALELDAQMDDGVGSTGLSRSFDSSGLVNTPTKGRLVTFCLRL
jgi:prepilin-type N-terminal cleavage/methylation domain-containing protein